MFSVLGFVFPTEGMLLSCNCVALLYCFLTVQQCYAAEVCDPNVKSGQAATKVKCLFKSLEQNFSLIASSLKLFRQPKYLFYRIGTWGLAFLTMDY